MFYLPLFRNKLEMTEAIKVKEAEAEIYISEIEVSFITTLFFILELDENQFDGFAPIIFSCMTIN
jgi:hypothetical protein